MIDHRIPESRVRLILLNAPSKFTLLQFVRLYRATYGIRNKDMDPPAAGYPWKHLAAVLTRLGAQQIGRYVVRETRFANSPQKETPEAANTHPSPAAPTTTIERLEARLNELQRVVDLQTKIKEVEAQIALF